MKKNLKITFLTILYLSLLVFYSCNHDYLTENNTNTDKQESIRIEKAQIFFLPRVDEDYTNENPTYVFLYDENLQNDIETFMDFSMPFTDKDKALMDFRDMYYSYSNTYSYTQIDFKLKKATYRTPQEGIVATLSIDDFSFRLTHYSEKIIKRDENFRISNVFRSKLFNISFFYDDDGYITLIHDSFVGNPDSSSGYPVIVYTLTDGSVKVDSPRFVKN